MIQISNLSKSFGRTKALSDVNLRIKPGEMVALIGASGSGKSTLLRHVSALVASDQGDSSVIVENKIIQSGGNINSDIRILRRRIGVVFQQFNLVGRLNVLTNILMGALGRTSLLRALFMAFSEQDRQLAKEALLKVGMAGMANQRASTLSGGQQQRAAIARTLVQKASLILADEPIASLDPESSIMVMELLRKLNLEDGLTVVVSLHQIEYAIKYCPRAVALCCGQIYYDGPSKGLTVDRMRTIYGESAASLFKSNLDAESMPRSPKTLSKRDISPEIFYQ
ncbi:MAG: phosphonate ABC transporter ATP-binding protein [Deltaproteobacteria bacterium]|jgi:phosphonate transport system ATP-binding protein|nr:phosphonate ABC transporter ATP-binding protein [Deltaproteobacteria bacterium]